MKDLRNIFIILILLAIGVAAAAIYKHPEEFSFNARVMKYNFNWNAPGDTSELNKLSLANNSLKAQNDSLRAHKMDLFLQIDSITTEKQKVKIVYEKIYEKIDNIPHSDARIGEFEIVFANEGIND